MRIAQLANIIERVPPQKYGGSERVINILTEGLIKRGHEVTLFATGDSLTSARLVSVTPSSTRQTKMIDPYGANALTSMHYGLAYKMQDRFDIIHDHIGSISAPTANISQTPVVTTLHGPFTPELQELYTTLINPYLVSISQAQIQHPSKYNHIGTIYNGLNMDHYPFSQKPDNYLLFVGRITMEKGVHFAIKVAQKLNLPLIIAAKLETNFAPDVEYFKKYIKPNLSDQIRWIGEVDEAKRNKLMSRALCFLHPITWAEPFGLTIIESMACGTPVIAFDLGSIPELIINGQTGFVVKNLSQMIKAVKNISQIDRRLTRQHSLKNFSGDRMVEGYLNAYQQIIELEKNKKAAQKTHFLLPDLSIFSQPLLKKPLSTKVYEFNYAHDIKLTRAELLVNPLISKKGSFD